MYSSVSILSPVPVKSYSGTSLTFLLFAVICLGRIFYCYLKISILNSKLAQIFFDDLIVALFCRRIFPIDLVTVITGTRFSLENRLP